MLTDGVGAGWRQGWVSSMLAHWAAAMPVALVHMLPPMDVAAQPPGAASRERDAATAARAPNHRWQVELADAWVDPEQAAADVAGAVAIPVFGLMAHGIASCADLFTGGRHRPAKAMVILARDDANAPAAEEAPAVAVPPAQELVSQVSSGRLRCRIGWPRYSPQCR